MHFIGNLFHVALYQPLFNVLVLIYQYLPSHDFGIAIIILTILIRILIYPVMVKSIKSQKIMTELQGRIKEIQKRFKGDKEKQTTEIMALYKREKINPFGMYIPLIIQFIVLIAFYRVVYNGLRPESMKELYRFISNPGSINPTFLGLIDLSKANFIIAILAGITQFVQTKMMSPKVKKDSGGDKTAQMSEIMQKQMTYFLPLITVVFLVKLPAVIGVYWVVTSIFSIFQQYIIINKEKDKEANKIKNA